MTDVSVLRIDLGKASSSVTGLDRSGRIVMRPRVSRGVVAELLAKRFGCLAVMEACYGAHHVGRTARESGHEVHLMPPENVRPYVKAQKNDDRDAEAIAEAAARPTMRYVPLKGETQLDVQALHRARDWLVAKQTALINQLRALLLGRSIVLAQRWRSTAAWTDVLIADSGSGEPLSPRLRLPIADLRA